MCEKRKRVGIMGGTFDPIHIGHLILGETAYEQFDLDQVLFMPAGNPPHKRRRLHRATDEQRSEMVRRAIASNPHFSLSLEEMNEDGFTYTYRTLERLKAEHPDTDYFFILGADSLFDFDKWREPGRICRACTVVAATRNHTSQERLDEAIRFLEEKYSGTFRKLNSLNIDISSAMLRSWIAGQRTIKYYVPDNVIAYIRELKLCEKKNIPVSEIEKQAPFLLHAKLGVYIARKKYDVEDKEILSAVRWHTTGKPEMSQLEQIIYLADYIEPGRDKAPNLLKVRRLAFEDLDECMYEVLKDTLDYLGSNPKTLDPATKEAFIYYEKIHNSKIQKEANI